MRCVCLGILVLLRFGVLSASADSLVADCIITPSQVTELSSPVMGVIERVYVQKSDKVSKGQIVAQLDSSVEQAAVELARARANITSEVKEGQVNSDFDAKRKQRMESLFRQKTISEDIHDEVNREAALANVRLQQAKDLKQVRALELKGMEARLKQKTIVAPFDGYVLERYKNTGEFVEEQPIVKIAQLDTLNVEAVLPIELFGKIEPGMSAKITIPAFPSTVKSAEVVLVDTVGNAASSTFGVRLTMLNPQNEIPAGLRCQAEFR